MFMGKIYGMKIEITALDSYEINVRKILLPYAKILQIADNTVSYFWSYTAIIF